MVTTSDSTNGWTNEQDSLHNAFTETIRWQSHKKWSWSFNSTHCSNSYQV